MIGKIFVLLVAGFLSMGIQLHAQIKFEREYKLKRSEVPQLARSFVDSCDFSSKIKWYKEESEAGISVEAKVREAGKFFSIEFGREGELQDVELDLPIRELDGSFRKNIDKELSKRFRKFRIQRVQIQWTGSRESLLSLIKNGKSDLSFIRKYEIIVKGKKEKSQALYEILFDEQAKIERIAEIKTRNTDNLDF